MTVPSKKGASEYGVPFAYILFPVASVKSFALPAIR